MVKRKPDIPIVDYGKYYAPGKEPICPFANYYKKVKYDMIMDYLRRESEQEDQMQVQQAQANANQDGEDDVVCENGGGST